MDEFATNLRSWQLVAEMRSPLATRDKRMTAFRELLQLDTGWWADGVGPQSLRGYTVLVAQQVLARDSIGIRRLTEQQLADGVLLAFFASVARISQHPRAWFIGAAIRLAACEGHTRAELSSKSLGRPPRPRKPLKARSRTVPVTSLRLEE